jgi:UDP-glucose 6-dehydrogenase
MHGGIDDEAEDDGSSGGGVDGVRDVRALADSAPDLVSSVVDLHQAAENPRRRRKVLPMNTQDMLFGFGRVGKATANAFGIDHCFDWAGDDYTTSTASTTWVIRPEAVVKDCRYVWICVPTPENEDGSCDTSIVEKVISDFAGWRKTFVIRSTVIPGTAKRLIEQHGEVGVKVDIISFPEFGSEDTMEKDVADPWLSVVGGETFHQFVSDHRQFFDKCRQNLFARQDNSWAEMTKCAVNSLFATLVVFGNQLFDTCAQVGEDGIDPKRVVSVLAKIPWREQHHLDALHKGYRGYSGSCLPKDIRAMIAEYDLPLLREVDRINQKLLEGNT